MTTSAMHTFESLLEDPHLGDIGFFSEAEHPHLGALRQMAVPSEWSATPAGAPTPAPKVGEQSREILREAGYDDAAIDGLVACGALFE